MTSSSNSRDLVALDRESGSAIKLTVKGRSAPYVARQTHSSQVHSSAPDHVKVKEHQSEYVDHDSSYSTMIPAAPLQCRFVGQRLGAGLRSLAGVLLGIGVGVYLATEVTTTPPLHTKVAFVAAVCGLLGLGLVPFVLRDLFGSLTIDSFGIRMTPRFFGFSIPWDELDRWTMDGPAFRFHSMKSGTTSFVQIDHLSVSHRKSLIETLNSCAPHREQTRDLRAQL